MFSSKHIVVFGAGKSAAVLIDYLKEVSVENGWRVTVADRDLAAIQLRIGEHERVKARQIDLLREEERAALVTSADVVISLLPPSLQFPVAKDCLVHEKHFLSASYIDSEIQLLANEIEKKSILFLCEMGLDPGIDHMSAMQLIHSIESTGGKIRSFRSHCGGLVAPESDDNCWHYKFTWNPKNVILAGKAGALLKQDSATVKIEYPELFADCGEVNIPSLGPLAYYYNRDSLGYISTYGLDEVDTFVRTTLRYPIFCRAWNLVIALGLTNEQNTIQTDSLTISSFYETHIRESGIEIPADLAEQFDFIGLHDDTMINKGGCSSAEILQWILEQKWLLLPGDKDMIVMLHEIDYTSGADKTDTSLKQLKSLLIVKGEDSLHTAMAKTVGLPLGIAARLLLEDKIAVRGLHIPIVKEIYEPVMAELEKNGVRFV